MTDCIFCKIVAGTLPARIVYQDDRVVAFDDLNPEAPFHKLIVPKKHIPTLNDLFSSPAENPVGYITEVAARLASELGISESGYRIVINCNADAGQTVFHLHAHLLGGRKMHWPPG